MQGKVFAENAVTDWKEITAHHPSKWGQFKGTLNQTGALYANKITTGKKKPRKKKLLAKRNLNKKPFTLIFTMQSVLNFNKTEVPKIKEFLEKFEVKNNTTEFQLVRAKIENSTVTLFTSGKTVIQGPDHEKIKEQIISEMGLKKELMVGIDEVGRGESFGPFVVTGVLGDKNNLLELRDSKKTKKISEKFVVATKNSLANATISFNAEFVDLLRKEGINLNKMEGIAAKKIIELFEELGQNHKTVIDGGVDFLNKKGVEFKIKADDTEPVVGAASVIAKFFREQSGDKKKRESWKKKENSP